MLRVSAKVRGQADEPVRAYVRAFSLAHLKEQLATALAVPVEQVSYVCIPHTRKLIADADLLDIQNDTLLEVALRGGMTATVTSPLTAALPEVYS